ncbi:TIR domain-containing protein [Vreelandella piezotolerans]|uniref:TIR domain-containing protein n=1 Tax=Vreelandella piezotolerans TaxID=2609667 RepID=A0ABQ6X5Z0_9GAMM|nr:TIR domain-containing protein [Halomonas piezotolerans]KAE8437444.1 TIR domain-containing protein [Halomonas piezotolerans]QJA24821.1 TIR domain-containing protein [Halomonas piezotolerans]
MKESYMSPLAVSFVWNLSDQEYVLPIIEVLRVSLARDKNRPFSRGLNIPLFFFNSSSPVIPPKNKPKKLALKNIIFVFTSVNTLGNEKWKKYIESIPAGDSFHIIPVAVDRNGLAHNGALFGLNCIRMYEWAQVDIGLYATVFLSHEIYRFGLCTLNPNKEGKSSSISIFLSHAKAGDTGRIYSERIKQFIDNTNMNRFFDANEISPGYGFDNEIIEHIKKSTLVALESDAYSSRYWCQREILLAKEYNRPVIVVNCLEDYEDRIFPAASNVPCVHLASSGDITDKDILRILAATIIEAIRFEYSMKCLESYKRARWINSDCALVARPPEIRQVIKLKKENKKMICYPEPPIYSEEADWHEFIGIEAFTPLWNKEDQNCFYQKRVGLSISDFTTSYSSSENIHQDCLVNLSQDIARHLLARSAILIYGGDLRPGGFTEFILDEARILNERLTEPSIHVENHLAWPLYISNTEVVAWRARYNDVMSTKEHPIPSDLAGEVSENTFLPPDTPQNLYIWSRCLTEMRRSSILNSTARICAGGRVSGYKGKMPGVLEEIIIALEENKPIFLLGAFGGIVKDVCKAIIDKKTPDSLTLKWQVAHNAGYDELQKIASEQGFDAKYYEILKVLQNTQLSSLASLCGLDENEYKKLMTSPFIDECVHIVLKGLKNIKN